MQKLEDLSQKSRQQLLEIEGKYYQFVDEQMSHGDWEHINFADFAVLYHEFYSRDVANQYWEELAEIRRFISEVKAATE